MRPARVGFFSPLAGPAASGCPNPRREGGTPCAIASHAIRACSGWSSPAARSRRSPPTLRTARATSHWRAPPSAPRSFCCPWRCCSCAAACSWTRRACSSVRPCAVIACFGATWVPWATCSATRAASTCTAWKRATTRLRACCTTRRLPPRATSSCPPAPRCAPPSCRCVPSRPRASLRVLRPCRAPTGGCSRACTCPRCCCCRAARWRCSPARASRCPPAAAPTRRCRCARCAPRRSAAPPPGSTCSLRLRTRCPPTPCSVRRACAWASPAAR